MSKIPACCMCWLLWQHDKATHVFKRCYIKRTIHTNSACSYHHAHVSYHSRPPFTFSFFKMYHQAPVHTGGPKKKKNQQTCFHLQWLSIVTTLLKTSLKKSGEMFCFVLQVSDISSCLICQGEHSTKFCSCLFL